MYFNYGYYSMYFGGSMYDPMIIIIPTYAPGVSDLLTRFGGFLFGDASCYCWQCSCRQVLHLEGCRTTNLARLCG